MTRQIINIGSTGNDGTGDAIRDAFGKVNNNFAELYAAQGLEAGIRFESLANVIKPFQANSLLFVQKNSDGTISVNNRVLASTDGYIGIDYSTSGLINLSLKNIKIQSDPNPQLANNLDAANHRIINLSLPTSDQDAVTQKWVYDNFLNRSATYVAGGATQANASTMTSNFRIVPTPNNGNANLIGTNRYLNIKGSDGITAVQVDLSAQGTDPAHAVRKDYADSKLALTGTNTIDPGTGQVNRGAGIMTGPLILSADPQLGDSPQLAATKAYVDSKSFSSTTNLFVTTQGRDDLLLYDIYGVPYSNTAYNSGQGYPLSQIGRSQAKSFASVYAAAKYARYLQSIVDLTTGYTVLPSSVTPYRSQYSLGGITTRVKITLANHGFVSGDYVDISGAISTAGQVGGADTTNLNGVWRVYNIFNTLGVLDTNNFIVDITTSVLWANPAVAANGSISIKLANEKDGPYTRVSKVGRGYPVKKFEITIFIESGVYYEQLPIVIPPNCALKGDEFRRTILRPAAGQSPSINQNLVFVRGNRATVSTHWQTAHYYHQLATIVSAVPVSGGATQTITISGAAYPPKDGMRFYISNGAIAGNGQGNQYRVASASAVDPTTNPLPGSYQLNIVDDQYDNKPLEATLAAGSTIEFFLDNEHCDFILVNDAFQARNLSWFGHKGFVMAFDPAGQILTRSPYAQVCASFSATGGGGQLIDGAAGNQYVTVQDVTYNDGVGNVGATGLNITITGALRAVQTPNTFYYNKKKYVIVAATSPDANGTVKLTLSSTTPIIQSDQYLPAGFIPTGAQLLIETAGNRSMLSNDFTMLNDKGYGIYADNNGVTESVSQFTYYCYISYYARAGAQVRSVTGSSCYGTYGLWADGSNPNEAIQVATLTESVVDVFTPYIDNPTVDGISGSTTLLLTNLNYPVLRNSTFQVDSATIYISSISKQTPTVLVPNPPLLVTTYTVHPFQTGQTVKFLNIPGGLDTTNGVVISNYSGTITVLSPTTFTIDGTNSVLYSNSMAAPATGAGLPYAFGVLTPNAKSTIIQIKGDPTDYNFIAYARTDTGDSVSNTTSSNVLKVYGSAYPAVVNQKFLLNNTTPAIPGLTSGSATAQAQVYTVTGVTKQQVQFQCQTNLTTDNKVGATTLVVTNVTSGFTPVARWSFQLLDPQLGTNLNYTRYTVTGVSTTGLPANYYALTITPALTVNMVNQAVGSGNYTTVDGYYNLTLDRNLLFNVPASTQLTFYNAYYSVNLNPALDSAFGVQTSNWGGGFVGYTKTYQLTRAKSAKVTQVLNTPTIILSSALQWVGSSYDSNIYRIIGKTQIGQSSGVFKTVTTTTPNLGLFPNAKQAIANNAAFLTAEATAYVNYTYPTLSYNITKCARDVGYILTAIENDIIIGGAANSKAAGTAYWNSGVSYLPVPQQGPEVAALQYVKTLLTNVINESAASNLKQPSVVSQTVTGTASETGVQQIVVNYLGLVANTVNYGFGFSQAASLLNLNKTFIAAEFNGYMSSVYPSVVYNSSALNTSIQAIVGAIASDIISGTAAQITVQTQAFFSSGVRIPTSTQAAAYVDALKNWIIPVMVSVVKNTVVQSPKQSGITQQTNPGVTYETGSDYQISFLGNVLANQLQYGAGAIAYNNGSTNINNNLSFVAAELIAYINATYVTAQTSPLSYHRPNFSTQIGSLVTAIKNDLVAGGAANVGAWYTTTYYSGGVNQITNTFYITSGSTTSVLYDALNQFKTFVPQIVGLTSISASSYGASKQFIVTQNVNPSLTAESNSLNTVNVLIQDIIDIIRYGFNFTNAYTLIEANKAFVQAETLAFLAANYPSIQFNLVTFNKNVGLIVEAIANDLIYGGNSNSVNQALTYYTSGSSNIPGGQLTPTVTAIQNINNILQSVLLNNRSANTYTALQNVVPQVYNSSITIETNAGTVVNNLVTITANIVSNISYAPTLVFTNNIQTITFGPAANDLYYGGILTGTGIAGVLDTGAVTTIRASQLDPAGSGNHIVKISQAVLTTIPTGTEITVTGPGYDFVFDFDKGLDARHLASEQAGITTTFSTVRATAHDFLEVGSGGFDDSNYPHNIYGTPVNAVSSGNLAIESNAGRVFHVSTDQDGNFRVGTYFNVNQGDGSVSLQANINLTNVSGLQFTSGALVTSFSTDGKMSDNVDNEVPTQKAVVSYINAQISGRYSDNTLTSGKGLLTLDGSKTMLGSLQMGGYSIENAANSTDSAGFGLVNRKYVDNAFAGGSITYSGNYPITITSNRSNVLAFSMLTDTYGPGGTLGGFGSIAMNNNKITGLRLPSISTDVATKGYVDSSIATGGVRTGWYGFTLTNAPTQLIQSLTLVSGGSGYTYPPSVTVVYQGSGAGANIEAVVSGGAVTGFNIVNPGYGFQTTPNIIIGGGIGSITVATAGTNIANGATVTFSPPAVTGGITATGTLTVTSGAVTGITITNPGSGYTALPTYTISGQGSGASATVTVNATTGQVQNTFVIVAGGSGYSNITPPAVYLVGGGGSGALATAVVSNAGVITNITLTNPGSGYATAPTVVIGATFNISLTPGTGASATATIAYPQTNINVNGNRITGLPDPINSTNYNTDAVTLRYLNSQLRIDALSNVNITNNPSGSLSDTDFLVFNGTGLNLVNVHIADGSTWNTATQSDTTGQSAIYFSRTSNSIKILINNGAVTDAHIRSNASIQQSKLALNPSAATISNAQTVPTSGQLGVAHFLSTQFNSNSGLISLKTAGDANTGVQPSNLAYIGANTILANLNGTTGAVSATPLSTLVNALNIPSAVTAAITDTLLSAPSTGNGAVLAIGSTVNSVVRPIAGALYFQTYTSGYLGTNYDNTTTGVGLLMPGVPANTKTATYNSVTGTYSGAYGLYDIGSASAKWGRIYCTELHADALVGGGTQPDIANSIAHSLFASTDISFSPAIAFNGRYDTQISVISSTSSTASQIAKRDSNADLFANNYNAASDFKTAGVGSGQTGSYYKLIAEDNVPANNHYLSLYRRDYSSSGTQTVGLRVGSTFDQNNYHYAQYHVFYPYSTSASGNQGVGATTGSLTTNAYVDATNAIFHGTATAAYYADVAEKYLPDAEYEPGTVVIFGGDKEITVTDKAYNKRAAGVISTNPAYMMNKELEGGIYVALIGRVPCKVVGKISKGDMLVTSTIPGVAQAGDDELIRFGTIIGKALEDYDSTDVGIIEVAVGKN